MRMLVDLREEQIERLNHLSRSRKVSRAELIRCAFDSLLDQQELNLTSTFGIWKDRPLDSPDYQRELRAEWDR